ncbi:hypothetical protein [Thiobacillus sp. 65-1402]|uniref:glycoside hydrolase family 19 protein n=1 Tax=Thiobacillus sp. 65-1402 TaxID=1895861 RepID=UPI00095C45D5|nr:hypothetical protein [Thiobacillus sp. 65-1402]OJW77968.1 MAG: hypothetical protein BGO62_10370 [Thiobacillus sp. 65-1402]
MRITLDQIRAVMPRAFRPERLIDQINDAMTEFAITSPARQAAFLAQVAHESGSLRYVEEIASGRAYEGRADLGNVHPGDGVRFKGRGLIQITGRANYRACSLALHGDERLLDHPEMLAGVVDACRSAAWFWHSRHLNDLADAADDDAFRRITRRVNGGYNGLADRRAYYQRAMEALA